MNAIGRIPRIIAVILTWNKKKEVLRLLAQLRDLEYPAESLEIVVVDNHSVDGSAQAVSEVHPEVILIRNSENLGGAGGFNTGMRWVLENRPDADYLWLLDDDISIEKDSLQELINVMEQHPMAALCGSRIMDSVNQAELVEVGAFIDYRRGDLIRNTPAEERPQARKPVYEVDYAAACSLLARMAHVRQLGLWNEELFIYWDDIEWGARFKAAGYKVLAAGAAVVYHPSWIGRRVDDSTAWRCYYRARNSLWFFNRYTKGFRRDILLLRMILTYSGYSLKACLQGKPGISRAFLNGMDNFCAHRYGKRDLALSQESAARRGADMALLLQIPIFVLKFIIWIFLVKNSEYVHSWFHKYRGDGRYPKQ